MARRSSTSEYGGLHNLYMQLPNSTPTWRFLLPLGDSNSISFDVRRARHLWLQGRLQRPFLQSLGLAGLLRARSRFLVKGTGETNIATAAPQQDR